MLCAAVCDGACRYYKIQPSNYIGNLLSLSFIVHDFAYRYWLGIIAKVYRFIEEGRQKQRVKQVQFSWFDLSLSPAVKKTNELSFHYNKNSTSLLSHAFDEVARLTRFHWSDSLTSFYVYDPSHWWCRRAAGCITIVIVSRLSRWPIAIVVTHCSVSRV